MGKASQRIDGDRRTVGTSAAASATHTISRRILGCVLIAVYRTCGTRTGAVAIELRRAMARTIGLVHHRGDNDIAGAIPCEWGGKFIMHRTAGVERMCRWPVHQVGGMHCHHIARTGVCRPIRSSHIDAEQLFITRISCECIVQPRYFARRDTQGIQLAGGIDTLAKRIAPTRVHRYT